jgi:hypothetical protein
MWSRRSPGLSIGGTSRGEQDQGHDAGEGEEEPKGERITGPSEGGKPIDSIAPSDETGDSSEGYVSASKGHSLGRPQVCARRRMFCLLGLNRSNYIRLVSLSSGSMLLRHKQWRCRV